MTSGNPVLDKNLEIISDYNSNLKDKLLNLPFLTNDIQLVETELKEPNLAYNGLFLHDMSGAEKESKKIFSKSLNEKNCINVIFGFGLGYLFKEFTQNAKGFVIVYEPNLEILRVTLELVDFSAELSQKNVRIVSDFEELETAFEHFYNYKSPVDFMVLDSYKKLYSKEISQTVKQLEMTKSAFSSDENLIKQKGLDFLLSVVNNLEYTLNATPLNEFKNIYAGKTALIISAGSTLDENIETIKKNRNKFIIFCVGTALKSLIRNGIQPDFVNIEEIVNVFSQISDVDLSEINLIVAPYTNEAIQKVHSKNKFVFPSSQTRGGLYWEHLTGIDVSEYKSRGTVASSALASAQMLGCSKLILAGQDLAFLNNSCYSKDSAYYFLGFETDKESGKFKCVLKNTEDFIKHKKTLSLKAAEDLEEFISTKIRTINNRLCEVKGISGEMLPTIVDYAMFVDVFKDFASENKNLKLINTSLLGAQLDGFENISLKAALQDCEEIEQKQLSTDFRFDKTKILNNLKDEKNYFEAILSEVRKTKEYFENFDKEFKRRNIVTEKAFKQYYSVSKIFDTITKQYFKTNLFYKMIVFDETSQIQEYISANNDSESDRIKITYNLLKNYFENAEIKILKLITSLNYQIDIFNNKE